MDYYQRCSSYTLPVGPIPSNILSQQSSRNASYTGIIVTYGTSNAQSPATTFRPAISWPSAYSTQRKTYGGEVMPTTPSVATGESSPGPFRDNRAYARHGGRNLFFDLSLLAVVWLMVFVS